MATVTGSSLLAAIQASTGVTLNALLQAALTAKLQNFINNNNYSDLAASIAIQAFSSEIKEVVDANGGLSAFTNHIADVVAAIEGDTAVPDFVEPVGVTYTLAASSTNLVEEGSNIAFTVTPSAASATAVTLYVQITGAAVGAITDQASADDFSAVLLPVTIPAGSTAPVVVSATVNTDATTEGPEGFQAKLLNSTFVPIAGVATISGTITESVSGGRTFILTSGVDKDPEYTGTAGNDTFLADYDIEAAAGAGAHTLGALDILNGGVGTDTDTLAITDADGAFVMAAASITGIENITIQGADTVTADVSGDNVTGLVSIAVTKATDVTLTADSSIDVTVTGATGVTEVDGADAVSITQNTNAQVGNGGAANDVATISVVDAKDVTIVANKSLVNDDGTDTDVGIVVDDVTGVVSITATGAATDGDDQVLDDISVTGGSTVTVTQVATSDTTEAVKDTTGATHVLGNVAVTAGDATTDVTVVQTTETSEALAVVGVAGVKQTKTVTFTAMGIDDWVQVDGLLFQATKALTAAQVAAAFASMSKSDTQEDGGITANGTYWNTTTPNWTSGAANGAVVTFTAVTAATGDTALATFFSDANLDDTITAAPVVTAGTAGKTAVTAVTGRLGVQNGKVTIDDNGATESIKNITIDGYGGSAVLGSGGALDALETLTLKNSNGATALLDTTAVENLTLNVSAVDATVSLDAGAPTVQNLTINSTGSSSSFPLIANNLTDLTVNAAAALTIMGGGGGVLLENVTVSGAAAVNLGDLTGNDQLQTFTSTNTAGVTVAIDTDKSDVVGGITEYVFGSGADVVTLTDTTVDIAVSTGAGNDKVTLATGTTSLVKNIDAGADTDTLVIAADDANTVSGGTTFETKIAGFEKLELGVLQQGDGPLDVNLANMDDINHVIVNGGSIDAVGGSDETAVVTFQNLLSGQSVTVAGRTVTANGGNLTAAQIEAAYLAGVDAGFADVSGTLSGWTVAESGPANNGALLFTSTTPGDRDPDISVTDDDAFNSAPSESVTTDGDDAVADVAVITFTALEAGKTVTISSSDGTPSYVYLSVGGETASQVAASVAADFANYVTPDTDLADYTSVADGATVTFTAGTPEAKPVLSVSSNSLIFTQPTVTSQSGGVDGETEVTDVAFSNLLAGQSINVGELILTASALADIPAAAVAAGYAGLVADVLAGNAVATGTWSGALGKFNTSGVVGTTVTFTDSVGLRELPDLPPSLAKAGDPTDAVVVTTDGGVGAAKLTVSNMANAGTVELSSTNESYNTVTVEMTDATGDSDSLNVLTKDMVNENVGTVDVDDVETIAITTTDTVENPEVNSAVTLAVMGDAIETVTVVGAGDLNLSVYAATTLTTVNAATMTGMLTYRADVDELIVTAGTAGDALIISANDVELNAGAGADSITVWGGADRAVITGGDGADVFSFWGASSTKDTYAVLTSVGSGDVIDFSGADSFAATKVTLSEGATESTQAYLNQAIADLGSNDTGWFTYNGNTFIVMDVDDLAPGGSADGVSYADAEDIVVMITGVVNLSTGATFNAGYGTLEIV